jgi:hypothetical protein
MVANNSNLSVQQHKHMQASNVVHTMIVWVTMITHNDCVGVHTMIVGVHTMIVSVTMMLLSDLAIRP